MASLTYGSLYQSRNYPQSPSSISCLQLECSTLPNGSDQSSVHHTISLHPSDLTHLAITSMITCFDQQAVSYEPGNSVG